MPDTVEVVRDAATVVEVSRPALTVELVEGGMVGPPGPAGPAGPPGTVETYVHTQTPLAATWVVVHGLGRWPSVTVVDTGETVVMPDVHYDDDDQLTLTFGAPTSGKVYVN